MPDAATVQKTCGIVLVAHGGQERSTAPVSASQLAVLRMIPIAAAIRNAVGGDAIDVRRPLFKVRGWNGAQASPVADLTAVLDEIALRSPDIPVVLVGHSMGARAAVRAAGHPAVIAVAGLAPWLPPGEPASQLAGRRLLLAHGTADRITRPADTWAYAGRARDVSDVTVIEIRGGDHPMIRRALLWHGIAAQFTRVSFGLPAGGGEAAAAITASARGAKMVTLW
ncbi:alpha/beta fold hydrolase [Trebonia kvetii]|uniref:Alpha/beta fold hydrolase n=1 Tax=Trebonia kvetii TaxID=2480626 RepID=A0A6P2BVF2_9ACTN|nr:alpha/beta fold hydrolase [Trebonia kvetii]TVZ01193.1 alpha/beta fold hydrolase [Trebonia kvetii]